jgi:hypothetical protein
MEFFQERCLPLELCCLIMDFASPWRDVFDAVLVELMADSVADIGVMDLGDGLPYRTACNRCLYFSAQACAMSHLNVTSLSYRLYFRRRKLELLAESPRSLRRHNRNSLTQLRCVDRLMDCDVWPVLYPKKWFDILCPRVSQFPDNTNPTGRRDPLLAWLRLMYAIRKPRNESSC